MQSISFTLPIVPTAQSRARYSRNGHAYKSERQAENEEALSAMLVQYKPEIPFAEPLAMKITALLPIPESASRKTREAMRAGNIHHTKKPDLDNLIKQMLDAMTRLRFWEDDKQVVSLMADKVYSDTPCWQVKVQSMSENSQGNKKWQD